MYRYLLALILLSMCLPVAGQVTPDVRKVVWGMSKEEVKNTEKLEPLGFDFSGFMSQFDDDNSDVSVLMYQTTVVGIKMILFYKFVDGKLNMMGYASAEGHYDYEPYASDFKELNSTLVEKYGDSKSDVDNASDLERKAGLTSDIGFMLSRGGYRRTVEWRTPRTVIQHEINNNELGVGHSLNYESIESYSRKKKAIHDDI